MVAACLLAVRPLGVCAVVMAPLSTSFCGEDGVVGYRLSHWGLAYATAQDCSTILADVAPPTQAALSLWLFSLANVTCFPERVLF